MSAREPQGEVDFLEREISPLNNAISQLQAKRAPFLRRLNSIRPSTRVFPPETLALIFQYAASPSWCHCFRSCFVYTLSEYTSSFSRLLALSSVSSHWRRVAWSTPQLWTSAVIHVAEKTAHLASNILELYLKNVRELPFDLQLIMADRDFLHPIFDIEDQAPPVRAVLFNPDYSRKIRTLELSSPPVAWLRSISASCFSRLESISAGPIYGNYRVEPLSFETLPRLREVELHSVQCRVSLPWTSITLLRLWGVPMDASAEMLTRCPNLTLFETSNPRSGRRSESHFFNVVTLSHLEDFSWSFHQSPWCLAALHYVRLPALRKLTWDQCHNDAGFEPSVLALFNGLPSTLCTLRLTKLAGWTLPLVRRVLSQAGFVREVTLKGCTRTSVYEFLSALCPARNGYGINYLPYLTSLTIDDCRADCSVHESAHILGANFSHLILEVCKARCIGPGSRTTFNFNHYCWDCAPEVRDELFAMVCLGFLRLRIPLLPE